MLKEAKKINDVSEDKLIEYTDTMVFIILYTLQTVFIIKVAFETVIAMYYYIYILRVLVFGFCFYTFTLPRTNERYIIVVFMDTIHATQLIH